MIVNFPDASIAVVSVEKDEAGHVVERRVVFNYSGLDYSFSFLPHEEDPAEGATLTYVGDQKRGRLTPGKFAKPEAWEIANRILGIIK